MRIKDMNKHERPRERLESAGPSALSEAELLAVILRTGSRGEHVLQLCQRLLADGLAVLANKSVYELTQQKGLGRAKALQIVALIELARRFKIRPEQGPALVCASDVYSYITPKLHGLDREHFILLLLDTKNRLIKDELISIGTLDSSIVHPREIFKSAFREGARSVILVHNHPSGDPSPSSDDLQLTDRLIACGELLGIPVLDHVIIGNQRWWSYNEK